MHWGQRSRADAARSWSDQNMWRAEQTDVCRFTLLILILIVCFCVACVSVCVCVQCCVSVIYSSGGGWVLHIHLIISFRLFRSEVWTLTKICVCVCAGLDPAAAVDAGSQSSQWTVWGGRSLRECQRIHLHIHMIYNTLHQHVKCDTRMWHKTGAGLIISLRRSC